MRARTRCGRRASAESPRWRTARATRRDRCSRSHRPHPAPRAGLLDAGHVRQDGGNCFPAPRAPPLPDLPPQGWKGPTKMSAAQRASTRFPPARGCLCKAQAPGPFRRPVNGGGGRQPVRLKVYTASARTPMCGAQQRRRATASAAGGAFFRIQARGGAGSSSHRAPPRRPAQPRPRRRSLPGCPRFPATRPARRALRHRSG